MGGTGGRFYNGNSSLSALESGAKDQVQEADFAAKVGEYLGEILSDANARDVDATNAHLDEIRKALSGEIEETVDLLLGGSASKRTHFEGLSDVDCLAVLKGKQFENLSPAELKERFAQILKERFPRTSVTAGDLAVTIQFSDMEIQVLPALKRSSGICIADKGSQQWKEIYPKAFRAVLTEVNQKQGGQVIPLIKIAKQLFSTQPVQKQPEGYHLECLAVEAFRNYNGEKIHRLMLPHLLESAAKSVLQPMRDVTGQSTFVDQYLGTSGSVERKNIADAFSTLARRLKNAADANSIDKWKKVFEG